MKGFVYIMSNKAMPGLVKIGFSTKHPAIRAIELDGTGLPHKFAVEYCAFVDEPNFLEQRAHKALGRYNEGKEFFRISVETAITCILDIAEDTETRLLYEEGDLESRATAKRDRDERAKFYSFLANERRQLLATEKNALDALLTIVWLQFDSNTGDRPLSAGVTLPVFTEAWFLGAVQSASARSLEPVAIYEWIKAFLEKHGAMPSRQEAHEWTQEEKKYRAADTGGCSDYSILENRVFSVHEIIAGRTYWEKEDLQKQLRRLLALPQWKTQFEESCTFEPATVDRIRTFFMIESEYQKQMREIAGPENWLDLSKTKFGQAARRRCRVAFPNDEFLFRQTGDTQISEPLTEKQESRFRDTFDFSRELPAREIASVRIALEYAIKSSDLKRMEKTGFIKLKDARKEQKPEGQRSACDQVDGSIIIWNTVDDPVAVLWHEGSHTSGTGVLARGWKSLIGDIWKQAKAGDKRARAAIAVAAAGIGKEKLKEMDPAEARHLLNRETLAYYIEHASADQRARPSGLLRRILGEAKAAWRVSELEQTLARRGVSFKLTDQEALALARRMLRVGGEIKVWKNKMMQEALVRGKGGVNLRENRLGRGTAERDKGLERRW